MSTSSPEHPHRHIDYSPHYEAITSNAHQQILRVEEFINQPERIRAFLEERRAFHFKQFDSGLFPACELTSEVAKATGMDNAWLRDNAHVANAHLEVGNMQTAAKVGSAMLHILKNSKDLIDGINNGSIDPSDRSQRIPVRVEGDTLTKDPEPRVQNDSVGYALWFIGRCFEEGALSNPNEEDLSILADTVCYLGSVKYWQDFEEGHWEEDMRLQAPSVGVAVAGIQKVQQLFEKQHYDHGIDEIDELVAVGKDLVDEYIDRGIASIAIPAKAPDDTAEFGFDSTIREADAAMLFLIEPLDILSFEQKQTVVALVESRLKGQIGFNRYEGDTYYGLGQSDTLSPNEITKNGGDELIERRNSNAFWNAYTGKEAQWTLFDPILATYYGKKFLESHVQADREKQLEYLNRTIGQFIETTDGRLVLPELYYLESREVDADGTARENWIPNQHRPLLWSQANLMRALTVFEETN